LGTRKTHVAVVSAYPPDRGRLSEYAKMLLTSLIKTNPNLKITVLADSRLSYSDGPILVRSTWKPDSPTSLLKIVKEIIKLKPHLVIFNVHFAVFGKRRISNFIGFLIIYITNLLKKILKFKTITILHNIPEAIKIEVLGLKRTIVNNVGFLLAEKMALSSNVVAVTLKLYAIMLEKRFRKKILHLPHGAWSWNTNTPIKPDGRDVIAFIGYLSPTKDLEVLVNAFKKVKEKNTNVKLYIIGSPHPNFPEAISKLVSIRGNGVEILGYIPDEKLPKVFRKTLVVVLPYKTATGSSGVLHLVCSAGIPVISVDLPEFRELAKEGAGIVLTKMSAEDIANKIQLLIKNKGLWYSLSNKSMDFGIKRSWDNVAKELNNIIDTVLKH